jgi:hypothetical protein
MNVEDQVVGERFAMYRGDCVDLVRGLSDESIHYSIFSPPFASLYTYSASPRDLGNCTTHKEFFAHFSFLAPELLRVTKPGRLLSMHCMDLPTSKTRDGYIGITDFPGQLTRLFVEAGWIMHSKVSIWKDPVTAMQRTKALGLLHKQIRKDSCMSRQGIADYLVTFRKDGDNAEPRKNDDSTMPVAMWQRYASPVWVTTEEVMPDGFAVCTDEQRDDDDMSGIDPSDTLQFRSAREHNDERHVCPLQLRVIKRGVQLWSNPGDTVLSPFGGIGSEGYVSLQEGRRYIGFELKHSYFKAACANLAAAVAAPRQGSLFDLSGGST